MIFLDTSVWVAAFSRNHPHYPATRPLLQLLDPGSAASGMHSLAEVYFALTRMPGDTRAHPRQAMEYVTSMAHHSTLIALEADDYVKAIELVSGRGMSGGMIYDALLLTCARKAKADRIYTWNLRHFRMIAPDLAERIVAPGE